MAEGLETPRPSGPFGVGVVERDGRWLIYYPAEMNLTAQAAPALPKDYAADLKRRFGSLVSQALEAGKGFAVANARPATGARPVIVFAPGWHMMAQDYRAVLEDIASRGYVIVALERLPESQTPPYTATARALTEGRALAASVAADRLDWLNTAIDSQKVVLMGHSVGGAAAVLAASADSTVKGAVNLDGDYADEAASARPTVPMLYMLSYAPDEAASSVARRAEAWRRVKAKSSAPLALQIQGFRHLNFLDAALLAEQVPLKTRASGFGYYIPAAGLRMTADLVAAFCDEYANGKDWALAQKRVHWRDAVPLAN
ncbi:alpha/beta fold hydrolase [Asticcacaulis sp. 201]|uniref:alpha/beta fold hydrolase n=1 Tax=Asticcacaulis sp. 201 TaxID=3028787 RepID=UPI0029169527|nr:alpha/beta fold hydrolase [Asticcacaulis sp. 201]MDV6329224.1 alpha/beta fold hydrolase [Asticcacaulis sp. 201]